MRDAPPIPAPMGLFEQKPAPRPDAAQGQRVKGWFREALGLGEEATLAIAELRCSEEGCPDVETVVALLHAGGRQHEWHFLLPLERITRQHIAEMLERFPFQPNPDANA
jgi:hypothetical protein